MIRSAIAITSWRLLLLLFALVVSYLALVPTSPASIAIDSGWDKLNHVVGFAAMELAIPGADAE